MRRTVFITWAGILGLILLSACNNRWKALEEGFRTPPDSIRTAVYWYWLDNHISKEGVVKDLEAMKRVGITRAFIGNQSEGDADGPVWERLTWTNNQPYDAGDDLQSSGLLGPVSIRVL